MTIDESTGTTTAAAVPDEAPADRRTRRARHALRSKPVPIGAALVAVGSVIALVVRRTRAARRAHNRWRPAFLNR